MASGTAPRGGKHRKTLITIGVVVIGLFFAAWYALSYIRYDDERVAGKVPKATCRPFDPAEVTPAKTTLNVYNATKKNGLAASAAKQLAGRGFVIREVANVPGGKALPGVAEVRYGAKGSAQAKLVVGAVGKGATSVKDARADATVDLVIGAQWAPLKAAASPTGLPTCPSPTP